MDFHLLISELNALKHDMTVGKMVFSDWLSNYLTIGVLKI